MPAYNAEAWLASALESLQKQTFDDFELIVSDNASTDGTVQIAQAFAKNDSRIRVLRHDRNVGANGNYRAVLMAANADLFKWAAVNDLCAPRFLELCVDALDKDMDAVLAYPRTLLFEDSESDAVGYEHDFDLASNDRAERFEKLLAVMRLNNAMNGVVRRRVLLRALPLGNFRNADILLMCELALLGRYVLVDEPLFYRRMSPEAATSRRGLVEADAHLVPETTRPLLWQNWRYLFRLLRIVFRSTPYDRQWGRIVYRALRRLSWTRGQLVSDVQTAFHRTIGK
jgi:glycosyltransferase involved in cell wall biosynthesis